MSLSTSFLNLSIKEQICITIIVLTFFCILVILIVCCTLIYEILSKDFQTKKAYFYKKYQQYLESAFYYQSFHAMQYEEILHRIQKQIWKIQQSIDVYLKLMPLQDDTEYVKYFENRSKIDFNALDRIESKENPFFYVTSLSKLPEDQVFVLKFSWKHYQTFCNSLFTNNIFDSFTIPGYGVPIMDKPLFFNQHYKTIFTFNQTKINAELDLYENNIPLFDLKLQYIISRFVDTTKTALKYIGNKLGIFQQIFPKFFQELSVRSNKIFYDDEVIDYFSRRFVGYLSNIEYGADTFSLVSSNESEFYYYTEMKTIPNLLFFLNQDFSYSLNIDFIPFYYPNMTLLNHDLCALFKSKQSFLKGSEFNFNDVYSGIHPRESGIENCFIDNELINSQEEIKDVFDIYFDNFTENMNLIYQGIFELIPDHSEFPFYFMKYSYPNYNTLKEFQSEYILSTQVNFYAFASFQKAQKYVDHIYQVNLNIFFFIILIIVYSWLICLFINIAIFYKVIDDWIEPITKLQEAVESSSMKDESIFEYKYDDIINELFLTCKELLSGQINHNNDNGINNFNILGKDNDKKIDKNIYKKNLIINNEIMEELIGIQQSEMDFSNNVKLNEPNNIDSKHYFNKEKGVNNMRQSNINLIAHKDSNKKNIKDIKDKKNIKAEKNKENESYIKLFKISDYLDYYRSKLDSNNIIFFNDGFDDANKSQLISKNNNNKSENSSLSNNAKNRTDEANENNYINMMDENNITYLWYMEAKKRNRCFNYKISNDCKELFTEYYDNNDKSIPPFDVRKSNIFTQKEKSTGM